MQHRLEQAQSQVQQADHDKQRIQQALRAMDWKLERAEQAAVNARAEATRAGVELKTELDRTSVLTAQVEEHESRMSQAQDHIAQLKTQLQHQLEHRNQEHAQTQHHQEVSPSALHAAIELERHALGLEHRKQERLIRESLVQDHDRQMREATARWSAELEAKRSKEQEYIAKVEQLQQQMHDQMEGQQIFQQKLQQLQNLQHHQQPQQQLQPQEQEQEQEQQCPRACREAELRARIEILETKMEPLQQDDSSEGGRLVRLERAVSTVAKAKGPAAATRRGAGRTSMMTVAVQDLADELHKLSSAVSPTGPEAT